jgi:phosphatidylglycerophosphatase A
MIRARVPSRKFRAIIKLRHADEYRMPLKESSDELNPAVAMPVGQIPRAKGKRTAGDYVALAIATVGVGYVPVAPGTVGSLVGLAIFLTLFSWMSEAEPGDSALRLIFIHPRAAPAILILFAILLVTALGTWASTRTEKLLQRKDPSIVVVDEVAGQMIALLPVLWWRPDWFTIFAGFVLFRAFDIWKPYPIRRLEGLRSGYGIMADDLLAGVYGALILSVINLIRF